MRSDRRDRDGVATTPKANPYFVETGFFQGEGAMKALASGLFQKVISIEAAFGRRYLHGYAQHTVGVAVSPWLRRKR